MRLFTGIDLAPNVVDRLSAALNEFRPTARINWSPVENLHLTIRFIGAWPEDRLSELKSALGAVAVPGPVPITISRFGFFPNPHHPHSFFADVQAAPRLTELATAIDHALLPLGLAPETRPYVPHVTLARIKGTSDTRRLREYIAAMTDFNFGSFHAPDFHLYLSQHTTGGSAYTKLATYDLMRENKTIS
jgi:2'-5' RNA ligase